jgi:hypothetical protein
VKDAVRRRLRTAMEAESAKPDPGLVNDAGEYVGPPRSRMFTDPRKVAWRQNAIAAARGKRLH